ncbi:MAG: RNA polymerase sigma factor SigM [Dermatophilaceae bacterium]
MDDLTGLADSDLIARHVAGDHGAAFGELFRRHRDRLYAVAVRTTSDRERAADAVQEAFISAFRRADTYRGEAAVTTWLHRIVVNACLDRLRRERAAITRRAGDLGALDLPDRHDRHSSTEVQVDVRRALQELPEGQRMALILVDMHGLSVSEVAEILDVAEGTIKSRCFRGREALAELLGLEPRHREPPLTARGASGSPVASAIPGADDMAEVSHSPGPLAPSGTTTAEPRSAP